jgi:hypothetical protein
MKHCEARQAQCSGVGVVNRRGGNATMSDSFRGTVNMDVRDSVPDWEPYVQPVAPDGLRTCSTSFSTTSATPRWSLGAA